MRRVGRVRRVGVVLRNHSEALTLLLQEELRGERPLGRSGWRRDGVRLREEGCDGGKGCGARARCGNRAAHEDCQFPGDALQEYILVVQHTNSLDSRNPDCQKFYTAMPFPPRDYFRLPTEPIYLERRRGSENELGDHNRIIVRELR